MADSKQFIAEVTIASGQTKTDAINMSNFALMGVEVPATMTGTSLTFEAGSDAASTVPVRDVDGADFSVTLGSGAGVHTVNANDFASFKYIKIVSGSSEGAERTLKVYGYKA